MKQPITFVITCSEDLNRVETCIESCRDFADEILVAECAADSTVESITAKLDGVRVVPHEPIRSDDFLNWVISQASHTWVLLLDSDEKMSQSLAEEIELVLSRGATYDAYSIDRETFIGGKRQEATTASGSRRIRLFRIDQAFFQKQGSSQTVDVQSTRVGKLSNKIKRYPNASFETALESLTQSARQEAAKRFEEGTRPAVYRLLLSPVWHFGVQYFWRGSIFDGATGVRCAWQVAFQKFCTAAFLKDLHEEASPKLHVNNIDPATVDLLDPTFRRAA